MQRGALASRSENRPCPIDQVPLDRVPLPLFVHKVQRHFSGDRVPNRVPMPGPRLERRGVALAYVLRWNE
jgi:hypothetical protein